MTNDSNPPEELSSLAGTTLGGRYRLIRLLGQGGWGTVYLAEHVTMGRRSAIKLLHRPDDPEAVARFIRGSRNAAQIDHPNVCRVFDYGDPPGGYRFLVMEYVEGDSLQDIMEKEGALPPTRAAWITKQTADALQAAHNLDIVHRDLKPGNIMITRAQDGREFVKVVDFDIAKGPSEAAGPEVTQMGWVIGTPEYMSPEQFMAQPLDGRSDLYSLGVMLFRMLTGQFPFNATAAREIMLERMSTPPKTLGQVAPGHPFPSGLQAALDRALSVEPEERWPSASQFGAAVWTAVHGTAAGFEGTGVVTPSPLDTPGAPLAGVGSPTSGQGHMTAVGGQRVPKTQIAQAVSPALTWKGFALAAVTGVTIALGGWAAFASVRSGAAGNGNGVGSIENELDTLEVATFDGDSNELYEEVPPQDDPTGRDQGTTQDTADSTTGEGETDNRPAPGPTTAEVEARLLQVKGVLVDRAPSDVSETELRAALSEALGVLELSVEDPLRAEAAFLASVGFERLGNRDDSIRLIREAVRLNPTNVRYQLIRDQLTPPPQDD